MILVSFLGIRRTAWSLVWLIGGALSIAGATLWPFSFQVHAIGASQYFRSFALAPSSLLDFPRNVILFMPFGFGVASLATIRGWSQGMSSMLGLLAGLTVALSVESLQVFQPLRTANVSDIVANTLGSFVGAACVSGFCEQVCPPHALVSRGRRYYWSLISAYVGLMLLLAWLLMGALSPGGWVPSYRMALKNELTGDRPWRGIVQDLVILDCKVDAANAAGLLANILPPTLADKVVAEYALNGEHGLSDRSDVSPELRDKTLLATEDGLVELVSRVNGTGEFTIAATISTFDLSQVGPARIITISRDPFERNLTIAQEETRLVLRWRSPLTGKNGATPELHFDHVFRSSDSQRVVVSTDGINTWLYTSQSNSVTHVFLGPEMGLMALLREGGSWSVVAGRGRIGFPALLFSAILFVPFGVVLRLSPRLGSGRISEYVWILIALILPAVLLEACGAWYGGELRLGMAMLHISQGGLGFVLSGPLGFTATAEERKVNISDRSS